jgi:hypothetical protein
MIDWRPDAEMEFAATSAGNEPGLIVLRPMRNESRLEKIHSDSLFLVFSQARDAGFDSLRCRPVTAAMRAVATFGAPSPNPCR